MSEHQKFMARCIQIARNGLGTTRPNPMVGAVIVESDRIIGEGITSPFGGPHAEVKAINSVLDKSLLKNATLYVTLEPCSHYGKTPPCSDLIIKHKIPNVVIGCLDHNPIVSGRGIAKLKNANTNVSIGVLENECREHHKRFFTFHEKKRPYIILKWAESSDGFLSPNLKKENKPVWITTEVSRQLVHKWRTEEQAILIGGKTAIEDNPSLTSRKWKGQNPTRIVLDKYNNLSKKLSIFDASAETIKVFDIHDKQSELGSISIKQIDFKDLDNIASQVCDMCFELNINSVIVEGGSKTLKNFINAGLWDEARVFVGEIRLGKGTKAPRIPGTVQSISDTSADKLFIYKND